MATSTSNEIGRGHQHVRYISFMILEYIQFNYKEEMCIATFIWKEVGIGTSTLAYALIWMSSTFKEIGKGTTTIAIALYYTIFRYIKLN